MLVLFFFLFFFFLFLFSLFFHIYDVFLLFCMHFIFLFVGIWGFWDLNDFPFLVIEWSWWWLWCYFDFYYYLYGNWTSSLYVLLKSLPDKRNVFAFKKRKMITWIDFSFWFNTYLFLFRFLIFTIIYRVGSVWKKCTVSVCCGMILHFLCFLITCLNFDEITVKRVFYSLF